jgi:hypothetical protein
MNHLFFNKVFLIVFFTFIGSPLDVKAQNNMDTLKTMCQYLVSLEQKNLRSYQIESLDYYSLHKDLHGRNLNDLGYKNIKNFETTREDDNGMSLNINYEREIDILDINDYELITIEKDLAILDYNLGVHLKDIRNNLLYYRGENLTDSLIKEFHVQITLINYKNLEGLTYNNELGLIKYPAYVDKNGIEEFFLYKKDVLNPNFADIQYGFLAGYWLIKYSNSQKNSLRIKSIDKEYKERKPKPKAIVTINMKFHNIYKRSFDKLNAKYTALLEIQSFIKKYCKK